MARGQNLLNKVFNKPLLITPDYLKPIAEYLSDPKRAIELKADDVVVSEPMLADFDREDGYQRAIKQHYGINPDTNVGILEIDGVLVNREGSMNSQCIELTSYQGLKKQFAKQVSLGMTQCVMMISSGGGECFGAWSTANYVKKVAKQNGVKLTSYVNGSACSAAYAWAAIADEIISHPLGQTGSIGVLIQLYNDSKMLEKEGIERSFVFAGDNKIPFDKTGQFTDGFISELQESVDKTYDKFVSHIADHRGLSKQQVIDTQASVFDAEVALEKGLIDKVMELEDFELEYGLVAPSSSSNNGQQLADQPNQHLVGQLKETTIEGNMTELEKLQAQLTAKEKELSDVTETNLAELNKANEASKTLTDQVAELTKQLGEAQELTEQLTTELDGLKLDTLTANRKAQLESVLGTENEQVATLLTTTASLDDTAFTAIVSAMNTSQVEKEKELTEVGNQAKQDPVALSYQDRLLATVKKR